MITSRRKDLVTGEFGNSTRDKKQTGLGDWAWAEFGDVRSGHRVLQDEWRRGDGRGCAATGFTLSR
jgi:hypothetical protein